MVFVLQHELEIGKANFRREAKSQDITVPLFIRCFALRLLGLQGLESVEIALYVYLLQLRRINQTIRKRFDRRAHIILLRDNAWQHTANIVQKLRSQTSNERFCCALDIVRTSHRLQSIHLCTFTFDPSKQLKALLENFSQTKPALFSQVAIYHSVQRW